MSGVEERDGEGQIEQRREKKERRERGKGRRVVYRYFKPFLRSAPPSITQATTSPIYTLVGSPFTLDCVWTGPPNSIQSWYLNGTLLSPSSDFRLQTWPNGSLTVSNPTESYTGTYMCNVSTPFQFVTSQVLVTVGGNVFKHKLFSW